MTPTWVRQRVTIRITRPGPDAESLVAALVEIASTSASVERSDEPGFTIVHLTQTDAATGAASIRALAAQRDPDWEALVGIQALPSQRA